MEQGNEIRLPVSEITGLVREGCGIRTWSGENSVSYLLEQKDMFFPLGFKALLAGDQDYLLNCVKTEWNGFVKLIYLTDGYRRLDRMLMSADADQFRRIAMSLIGSVLRLRESGVLKCRVLDISASRIFVDERDCEARLVYLPVSGLPAMPDIEFDDILRRNLVRWICVLPVQNGGRAAADRYTRPSDEPAPYPADGPLADLVGELNNPNRSLAQIYQGNKGLSGGWQKAKKAILTLTAVNPAKPMRFYIDRDEYILGKSPSSADGCITTSPYVGRQHCRIVRTDGQFYAVDLDSRNGTYLEEQRIPSGQPYRLASGCRLRLADVSFIAEIGEEQA